MKILKTITIQVRDNMEGRTFTKTELERMLYRIERALLDGSSKFGNSKYRPDGIELWFE